MTHTLHPRELVRPVRTGGPLGFLPTPGTWDNRVPADLAHMVLDWLAGPRRWQPLEYMEPLEVSPARWRQPYDPQEVDDVPVARHYFTMHRAMGPAVYVGDPFCWEWTVAVDDRGRWVSGESEQAPLPHGHRWGSW